MGPHVNGLEFDQHLRFFEEKPRQVFRRRDGRDGLFIVAPTGHLDAIDPHLDAIDPNMGLIYIIANRGVQLGARLQKQPWHFIYAEKIEPRNKFANLGMPDAFRWKVVIDDAYWTKAEANRRALNHAQEWFGSASTDPTKAPPYIGFGFFHYFTAVFGGALGALFAYLIFLSAVFTVGGEPQNSAAIIGIGAALFTLVGAITTPALLREWRLWRVRKIRARAAQIYNEASVEVTATTGTGTS